MTKSERLSAWAVAIFGALCWVGFFWMAVPGAVSASGIQSPAISGVSPFRVGGAVTQRNQASIKSVDIGAKTSIVDDTANSSTGRTLMMRNVRLNAAGSGGTYKLGGDAAILSAFNQGLSYSYFVSGTGGGVLAGGEVFSVSQSGLVTGSGFAPSSPCDVGYTRGGLGCFVNVVGAYDVSPSACLPYALPANAVRLSMHVELDVLALGVLGSDNVAEVSFHRGSTCLVSEVLGVSRLLQKEQVLQAAGTRLASMSETLDMPITGSGLWVKKLVTGASAAGIRLISYNDH